MIPTKQDILFEVANQVLVLVCPEGRPSSTPTFEVFEDTESEDGTAESALTGSATVDSVNTTLDASAASGQKTIPLTSTAGIEKGREYIVTQQAANGGRLEAVVVVAVLDGVSVVVQNPLFHDYASGAAFQSARVTIGFATAWVSDTNNLSHPLCPRPKYRAHATYTAGGETCRTPVFFDLLRTKYIHGVTPPAVDSLSRGWLSRLPIDAVGDGGQRVIDDAFHQVKLDLWERELAAYALRHGEVVNELVRLKAVSMVHEFAFDAGGVSEAQWRKSEKKYWDRVENLVPKAQMQISPDGAGGVADDRPLMRR